MALNRYGGVEVSDLDTGSVLVGDQPHLHGGVAVEGRIGHHLTDGQLTRVEPGRPSQ